MFIVFFVLKGSFSRLLFQGITCSTLSGCTSGTTMIYLAKSCDTSISTGSRLAL